MTLQYIDNDVIFIRRRKLPRIKGLMNVREPEETLQNFKKENKLNASAGYFNSGVTFCDKYSKKLSVYMINRLEKN